MDEVIRLKGMEFAVGDDLFRPSLTTKILMRNLTISEGDVVLDVGCGVGPIAIYAAMQGAAQVYGTDIMPEAAYVATLNAKRNGVEDRTSFMSGNLLDHVSGLEADVVVLDVPGLPEDIARISGWYPETVPVNCERGSELYLDLFKVVENYTRPEGTVYFPLGMDKERMMDEAHQTFSDVEIVYSKNIKFNEPLSEAFAAGKISLDDSTFFSRRDNHYWTLDIVKGKL